MSRQAARGGFGDVVQPTALTADRALDIARRAEPDAKPLMLSLPVRQHGQGATVWRVQMAREVDSAAVTVIVDDRTGQAAPTIAPQAGDRAESWVRWIHEGSHSGPIWAAIVFLAGVFPTIFAVTGITMWLRKRADRRAVKSGAAQLRPAE
jgi:uncharacterized iron-regulated membrane protein